MTFPRAVYLLFALNFVDALVTIGWVQSGLAPEANHLMAKLLETGVLPFLLLKLGVGVATCYTLLRGSQYVLARVGVALALFAYVIAISAHVLTGLAVSGVLT